MNIPVEQKFQKSAFHLIVDDDDSLMSWRVTPSSVYLLRSTGNDIKHTKCSGNPFQ